MSLWAASVYLLCFLTSVACALLLVRAFRRSRTRLLLWSAACFVILALNNLLLVTDVLLLPDVDLRLYRVGTTFVALCFLLYGFIWESESE